MSQPKTTWEDLARLGWPIYDVYKKANESRGGTMNGIGDIFLNSGIAADYQWWSYNTTIGKPYVLGKTPKNISQEEVAWSYDNTHNNQEHNEEWTESWTNTNSATLTVTNSVTITLSSSITIANVASSGFDISVSLEASSSKTEERSYTLTRSWPMNVGPGEKLTLYRNITTLAKSSNMDFGIANGSLLGTKGDKYGDHYYWGRYVNTLCNNPRGRLDLMGSSSNITYAFRLVRETADRRKVVTPLAVDVYEAKDADNAHESKDDIGVHDSKRHSKGEKDSKAVRGVVKAVWGDGEAQIMVAAPDGE
ncbi:uncharacterized protein SCHCODRAFT_02493604 [Schizophyllum commune H4-8]|nr:uncharacterized protein SCHCODRAFT_02493604 [Schizophyllum commune H4-8]KAI5896849.1 hypothetical protein SCHCODRAFT_02493604 [Schizophyllum commune H4-8]